MKVLVSLRVPGIDARDVIQAHRRYLVELMQQWTRIKEEATGTGDSAGDRDLSLNLAVDAEMFRLDGVMRWLDSAEARIRRAGGGSAPGTADGSAGSAGTKQTQAPAPLPRLRREMRTRR
jgi:hypothetical protein